MPEEAFDELKKWFGDYPQLISKLLQDSSQGSEEVCKYIVSEIFSQVKPSTFLVAIENEAVTSALDTFITLPFTLTVDILQGSVIALREERVKNVYWLYVSRRLRFPDKPAQQIFDDLIVNPSPKEEYNGHATTFNTYYGQWYDFIKQYEKATGRPFHVYLYQQGKDDDKVTAKKIQDKQLRENKEFLIYLFKDLEEEAKYFIQLREKQIFDKKKKMAEYQKLAKQALHELKEKLKVYNEEQREYLKDNPELFENMKDGILMLTFHNNPEMLSQAFQDFNDCYDNHKEIESLYDHSIIHLSSLEDDGYDVEKMRKRLQTYYESIGGTEDRGVLNMNHTKLEEFKTWCKANIFDVYNALKNKSLYIGPRWKVTTTRTIKSPVQVESTRIHGVIILDPGDKEGRFVRMNHPQEYAKKYMNSHPGSEVTVSWEDLKPPGSENLTEINVEKYDAIFKSRTIPDEATAIPKTPYYQGKHEILSVLKNATSIPSPKYVDADDVKPLVETAKKYIAVVEQSIKSEHEYLDKQIAYVRKKLDQVINESKMNDYVDAEHLKNCFPQTKPGGLDIASDMKITEDPLMYTEFLNIIYPRFTLLYEEDGQLRAIKELKSNYTDLKKLNEESKSYNSQFSTILNKALSSKNIDEIYTELLHLQKSINKLSKHRINLTGEQYISVTMPVDEADRENSKLEFSFDVSNFDNYKAIDKDLFERVKKVNAMFADYEKLIMARSLFIRLVHNYNDLISSAEYYIGVMEDIIKEREATLKAWKEFLYSHYKMGRETIDMLYKDVDTIKTREKEFVQTAKELKAVNFTPNINNYNFNGLEPISEQDYNRINSVFQTYVTAYNVYLQNKEKYLDRLDLAKSDFKLMLQKYHNYPLRSEEIVELMKPIPLRDTLPLNYDSFIEYIHKTLVPDKEYEKVQYEKYAKLFDLISAQKDKPNMQDTQYERLLAQKAKETLVNIFEAYERESASSVMKHVADNYRSNLSTAQTYVQLDQALRDDFRNLQQISFKIFYGRQPQLYQQQKRIVIELDWSRRATIQHTGQEWLLDRKRTIFIFSIYGHSEVKLVQMQGDTVFGLANPFGKIVITEGRIDLEPVTGEIVIEDGEIIEGTGAIYTDGTTPDILVINQAWYFSSRSTGSYASGDLYYNSNSMGHSYIGIPDDSSKIRKLTGVVSLDEVSSVPSSGYQAFYEDPMVGEIYAVQSRSTGQYAVIQIKTFGSNMRFDYKYPVSRR